MTGSVLLATKLASPPVRAEHVGRGELLDVLRARTARRLTLLSAPPGFGKTTLLAEWLAAERRPVAWLSLDEDDNDPARFFAYVIEALCTAVPDIGGRAAAAQATSNAGLSEVVLPLLVNDLIGLESGVVLVLDDYHLITNARVHQALTFLIERQPESLRLVIATREDPPLPLGRLRARGELGELRAADLRFSADEASTFLNDLLDLHLSAKQVARLQTRTEGWPAALYLVALSLRGNDDPNELIDAFAGDDRYLVDYLTAEVLARQSADVRAFLLRSSILTRLSGPLCDAVMQRDDSAPILEELEHSNLLLVPLDAKREWYRYHQLFADLLQHELKQTEPEIVPTLHRRASAWYRDAAMILDAARHARAAGDVDAAVELVSTYWSLFLSQGQLQTVTSWLKALPESVLTENWLLSLAAMTVAAHTDRLDEAEHWLATAERAPRVERDGQRPEFRLAAARAFLRVFRGDVPAAIAAAREGLAVSPSTQPIAVLALQIVLGAGLWWSGELTEAKDVLERASRIAEAAGVVPARIETLGLLAAIALDQGNAVRAEELTGEGLQRAGEHGLDEHPFTAIARIAAGRVCLARGELADARDHVERGIALGEREHNWLLTVFGLLALAEIRHREHEPAAARRCLARARQILEGLPDPLGVHRVEQVEKALRLHAVPERDAARGPYWELSERELDVLRMLASHLSQREIAVEMYVSFNTVKSHLRSIFRKLGVASRPEAVARARELGLLP